MGRWLVELGFDLERARRVAALPRRALRATRSVVLEAWRVYRLRYRPVVDVRGIRLEIGAHTSAAVQAEILSANYENAERTILESFLRPDDTVMELGTGLGFLAIYCAKRVGSERVFTYEANAELEGPVRRNCALNGVAPRLEICLLGRTAGAQTFYLERNLWSSSTLRRSPAARAVTVPVRPLNDELRKVKPSFLIIDIEGGERDLIDYVDLTGVERVVIELHPHVIGPEPVAEVRSFFTKNGFSIAHAAENVTAYARP